MNWKNKIKYLIETHSWQHVTVKQNDLEVANLNQKENEPQESFINTVQDYFVKFPGSYILEFKTKNNQGRFFTHFINTTESEQNLPVQGIEPAPEKIQGLVQAELLKIKEAEERKLFEQEREEFKTLAGKLSYLVQALVVQFSQGMQAPQTAPVQGAPPQAPENTPARNLDLDRESFEILSTYVDSETLNAFAKRIKKEPNVINTLKALL